MKSTKLFSCLYGSRLYGTQTPTSDLDVKHVVLPDLEDLLLGRKVTNSVKKTNTEKNTRNGADDVDEEFIPLQVFARDFFEGQTYALELAFAMEGTHANQSFYDRFYGDVGEDVLVTNLNLTHYGVEPGNPFAGKKLHGAIPNGIKFLVFVQELRSKFLTSNIKAMMGYVVNQASLYSFKGERLNAVRAVKKVLEDAVDHLGSDGLSPQAINLEVLGMIPKFAIAFTDVAREFPKYFRQETYDIGGGRMRPCFILLEKTLPYSNSVEHSLEVVSALEKKYGTRADAASESNVDWKATMHALRIVDEGLSLLQTHKLEFPFPPGYVEHLLRIKRGEMPLDPIKLELSLKLDTLKELEKVTTLPSSKELQEEFDVWLKSWMRKFYRV